MTPDEQWARWQELKATLKPLVEEEQELRRAIFARYFIDPDEGVNNLDLPNGQVLKGTRTINRSLNAAEYTALLPEFQEAKIPEGIVVEEPKFVLSAYRDLTDDQRAIFDQCLIIKDGMPSLEIATPKRKTS